MNLEELISAVQTELGVTSDGKAGPETWQAIFSRIVPKGSPAAAAAVPAITQTVDPRSEKTIATLQEKVRPYARALVLKAAGAGINIKVISGLRTYAEQDALYEQGRTLPGKIVTNAKGGYSNHNFGVAFDIGIFEAGAYLDESPKYKAVGALGMELGLEWGGEWTTITDEPHFELRPTWAAGLSESEMLSELRDREEAGKDYYA